MVGGEPDAFQKALPVFQTFAEHPALRGVGAGQAVKLVNQLLVGVHTAAIAEAARARREVGAESQDGARADRDLVRGLDDDDAKPAALHLARFSAATPAPN